MKSSVYCENKYEKELPLSIADIEGYAVKMFEYAFNNLTNSIFDASYDYNFDILLCDNDFIHTINKEYRNIDSATDVITFALYADSEDKIISDNTVNLGQIIISIDKTYSQASENDIKPEREFLNLLSHGILHLLGMDHPNDEELDRMLTLQDKMIESTNYVKI